MTNFSPDPHTPSPLDQRQQLQELARGYRKAQILFTCVELGVFAALAKGGADAQSVAAETGTSLRGMDLLLNAAAALGLLEKHGGVFTNTAAADAWLIEEREGSLAQTLRLEKAFYTRWGHLAEAVRSGRRPEENRQDERGKDWVKNFIHGLYQGALPFAPLVAEALGLPEDAPLKVIDVGGGHGAYSLALAERHPLLTATIFELPQVVPVAREIVAMRGLQERVSVQEGDFQTDPLGSGYDLALVFGVLNGEAPDGRLALFHKVHAALKPGGRIVIRDAVLQPDRAGPPDAALFALQMLLATDSGGLDTQDDWEGWLHQAGFSVPVVIPVPGMPGTFLTVAGRD